ncbi:hypothetical protein F7R08_14290 [Pseudomonas extremorientalis]|nr:hypothetical protein F7R08_14290 [Pseudomonas extremorientalis]
MATSKVDGCGHLTLWIVGLNQQVVARCIQKLLTLIQSIMVLSIWSKGVRGNLPTLLSACPSDHTLPNKSRNPYIDQISAPSEHPTGNLNPSCHPAKFHHSRRF